MSFFSSFFIALLVSMILVPLFMRYATVLKLTDLADERKVHEGVVPRSGGLAIVFGFIASIVLFWPNDSLTRMVVLGAMIIALFGFLDDRSDLNYKWKFFGQLLASIVVVTAGLKIEIWPFAGIDAVSSWLSIPVSVIFLIGVTNAMNLSDGLDGLAAGMSLITLSALAWLFWSAGNAVMVTFALAVIGAICGFLRYNNHPAVVFMGDTGSQFLGFLTGCLAIILCQKTNVALNPALLILLVGLPILDTAAVFLWRLRRGNSPFRPDKNHFHHRLLEFGLQHYEAVSAIYVVQTILVTFAVLVRYQGDFLVVGSYLLFALATMLFFRWARMTQWRVRTVDSVKASSERRNNWLRKLPWLPIFMERLTEMLASGFLIFGAIFSVSVSEDLGWGAAAIAAITLCAGIVPKAWRSNLLRVVVFLAGIVAVYSMLGQPRFESMQNWHVNLYMIVLGLCLLVSIRLTRREFFQTTPLDLLIIIFVLAVVVVTTWAGRSELSTQLADTAIRLAVFFYVGEYLSSRQKESFKLLPIAAFGAVTIIAARGLLAS